MLTPLVVAYIKDISTSEADPSHDNFGYSWVLVFFIILNVLTLCLSFYIYYYDCKFNGYKLTKVDYEKGPHAQIKISILSRSQARSIKTQSVLRKAQN